VRREEEKEARRAARRASAAASLPPPPPAAAPAKGAWEEKYSKAKNRKFWKNKETGETTWKEPPKEEDNGVDFDDYDIFPTSSGLV
jgi:hypothetical protein